jgi:hypothetical protein
MLLILVPVAAYGVARLAIWYTVKDTLDDVRASLSPVASLEYTKILSPIVGPFGATGIRVKPHVFKDEISVGSALIHVDDPIGKYEFLRALANDTIPTKFRVSLNGVSFPLGGDLAAMLDQANASANFRSGTPTICQLGRGTFRDIKNLGYQDLVFNLILDYSYDRRGGGLAAYVKLDFRDLVEVTLEGTVPPSDVVFAFDQINGAPRWSDLTVSMRPNSSGASRLNRYCADAMGITDMEYVQTAVARFRDQFTSPDFEPSDELLRGFQNFVKGTAPISVSFNPRDPTDFSELPFYDSEYLIDRLGIGVSVDGTPLQNLGTFKEPESEDQPLQQVMDETFKPTALQELPQYLESEVQIFTADGKRHNGYLGGVDAEKIVLIQHLVGGSATFDVARADVDKVLVLRP